MNLGYDRHFSYQDWENYAMGLSSGQQAEQLEEHLLVCSACQDLLAEADEYVAAAKAALTLLAHGQGADQPLTTNARKRKQLSKAMGAAANLH